MARQAIDTSTNNGSYIGDPAKTAFDKVNSNFSELYSSGYRRDNIIDTVKQSGGVPTGGIMEYGSNSNGSYVRFAGGLQICRKVLTGISISEQTSLNGWSYRSPRQEWVFPAVFSSTPAVSGSEQSADIDCKIGNLGSSSSAEFRLYYIASLSGRGAVLQAVGRWYE